MALSFRRPRGVARTRRSLGRRELSRFAVWRTTVFIQRLLESSIGRQRKSRAFQKNLSHSLGTIHGYRWRPAPSGRVTGKPEGDPLRATQARTRLLPESTVGETLLAWMLRLDGWQTCLQMPVTTATLMCKKSRTTMRVRETRVCRVSSHEMFRVNLIQLIVPQNASSIRLIWKPKNTTRAFRFLLPCVGVGVCSASPTAW